MADAGLCSRRKAEEWIQAGKVVVNGKRITTLGSKADPLTDKIVVQGKLLKPTSKKVYYLFHKPKNVMVTTSDPQGRPTIYDYLKKIKERVFPVGRLDFDSEGLILLTNDGELAFELTHPKSKVEKVYEVKISGVPTKDAYEKLERGIASEGEKLKLVHLKTMQATTKNCWLRVTLTEGMNRQVRRMLEGIGHSVIRLRRVAIGPFQLGELKPGELKQIYL